MPWYRTLRTMVTKGPYVPLAVVLGAAVLGAVSLWLVERELIARTGVSLALGAAEVVGKLDMMLQERDGDIQVLAANPQIQSADPVVIRAYLEAVQRAYPVYSRITVVGRSGLVVASTDEELIGQDLHADSWFQAVWHAPRVHAETVGELDRRGGALVAVVFSAPLKGADGAFLGAVMTEVDRAVWSRLVEEMINQFSVQAKNFGTVQYQVLSADGIALLTSEQEGWGRNLQMAGLPSALKVTRGWFGYVEEEHLVRKVPVISGYARMSGVRSIAGLQWGLLVRADRADVLASVRRLLLKLGFGGAVGFFLMLLAILWANVGQWKEQERSMQAKQALVENEAKLRAIVETSIDGIITIDEKGTILSLNPAAERLFGYPCNEIVGRNVAALMPEPYASEHDGYLAAYLRTGCAKIIGVGREVVGRRRDGTLFPLELGISEMRVGTQRQFTGLVRDISERTAMLKRIEETAVFFRLLSDHLPVGVFEIDARGGFLYGNQMWRYLLGIDLGARGTERLASQRRSWLEWFHPDDREKVEEEWEKTRVEFDRVAVECRISQAAGEPRWVNVLLWPMTTDNGIRFLGVMEDITARKRTAAHTMSLLQHGRFELRTPAEARNLAELLAYAFPDPMRSQLGLTELLMNAVEHGNLNVSYAEKSALLERGTLEAELERRLTLPEYQRRSVRVAVDRTERELELSIIDDGAGFDWKPYLTENGDCSDDSHGRGIAMSKIMSFDRIEYRGCGNHVVAATRLGDADPRAGEFPGHRAA